MSEELTMEGRHRVVIACRVMEPELSQVLAEGEEKEGRVSVHYLDQALHRTPDKMPDLVQERIDQAAQTASLVVLGYALCSKGMVGVTARRQGLLIPRCHDCIALFLGSPDRYQELFWSRPGTYYLTPGWVAEKKDPLGIMEEHVLRYGQEKARWIIEEELKHYTHIALIDTGVGERAALRTRAMENAELLKKEYEEITGSLDYFREILYGPYPEQRFLRLAPGEKCRQELFL